MHKRIPVVEVEIDDISGFIQRIGTVYDDVKGDIAEDYGSKK